VRGGEEELLAHFACDYADQTEKDYMLLAAAAKKGRIKVAEAGA